MADAPGGSYSPSMQKALGWAEACAALRGDGVRVVTESDLFLGLLLAHPDDRGEMRVLLAHFGLTARDLLPGDYPAVTTASLRGAARTVAEPSPDAWDPQVSEILATAGSLSGGNAQVAHVMSALLSGATPFRQRLEERLSRFGISATELAAEFQSFLVGSRFEQTESAAQASGEATLDLAGGVTAGQQIADWLDRRFPRRPATFAPFSSDAVDPDSDYIGIGPEADAFAYLIASKALAPPLAIGLFGDWGSGKSFLMSKIRRRVKDLTSLAASGDTDVQIWGNVAEIEFNAWQYVETDLWAALLHHIFSKLTPEQVKQMSELDASRKKALSEIEDQEKALAASSARVSELTAQVEQLSAEKTAARASVESAQQGVTALRGDLVAERLDSQDRGRLGQQVAASAALLGPEVLDLIAASRRVSTALRGPAWRQAKYWTPLRLIITVLSIALVPLAALVIDEWKSWPALATITSSIVALLPALVIVMRSAAKLAEQQNEEVKAAESEVVEKLRSLVETAKAKEEELAAKLTTVQSELATAIDKEAQDQRKHQILVEKRDAITPGRLYAEFLSARSSSDDYRKRLGLVTTVHEDLEKLANLTETYNAQPEKAKDNPPNRIVLYIDDLDRCPPKRVVEVLEAVHLLLAFKLFVVVVAVDTRWLTHALGEALPTLKTGQNGAAGAPTAMDYVEKIFQVPFWVEKLDDDARERLLRGLLMKSVGWAPVGGDGAATSTSWTVGPREEELVDAMLSRSGLGLDLDARQLTISTDELAFIESLAPLVAGTPRQVKRFVNTCLLLLAMSPPLSADGDCPTERMAACFMAALHESMPSVAAKLAERTPDPSGPTPAGQPLRAMIDRLPPEFEAQRDRLDAWLVEHNSPRPEPLFETTRMEVFLERWDVIRRMRFQMAPDGGAAAPAP